VGRGVWSGNRSLKGLPFAVNKFGGAVTGVTILGTDIGSISSKDKIFIGKM